MGAVFSKVLSRLFAKQVRGCSWLGRAVWTLGDGVVWGQWGGMMSGGCGEGRRQLLACL